ncbi:hypothetical protein LIA77_04778 [Sarocladium implicatum]|nr:hypothetical protein LIA77_04778 [Sarocladium implicatum]
MRQEHATQSRRQPGNHGHARPYGPISDALLNVLNPKVLLYHAHRRFSLRWCDKGSRLVAGRSCAQRIPQPVLRIYPNHLSAREHRLRAMTALLGNRTKVKVRITLPYPSRPESTRSSSCSCPQVRIELRLVRRQALSNTLHTPGLCAPCQSFQWSLVRRKKQARFASHLRSRRSDGLPT